MDEAGSNMDLVAQSLLHLNMLNLYPQLQARVEAQKSKFLGLSLNSNSKSKFRFLNLFSGNNRSYITYPTCMITFLFRVISKYPEPRNYFSDYIFLDLTKVYLAFDKHLCQSV